MFDQPLDDRMDHRYLLLNARLECRLECAQQILHGLNSPLGLAVGSRFAYSRKLQNRFKSFELFQIVLFGEEPD